MISIHSLGRLIVLFFEDYLAAQNGFSDNTIASYSTCIDLLLDFCAEKLDKTHDTLDLSDINVTIVIGFLDHLESERDNSPQSRNTRLAAIKSFFRFLASKDKGLIEVSQQIRTIRPKKVPHQIQTTLSTSEVKAFLTVCDSGSEGNLRDQALFYLLYNTGARAQELADLKLRDLRLQTPFQVTLTGKGSKQRAVLLWPETVTALLAYLESRPTAIPSDSLFLNQQVRPISRFGIRYLVRKYKLLAQDLCPTLSEKKVTTHTFRHATALHMIQSGIDITMVKSWLGHTDVNTTSRYIDLDMDMKQKILEAWNPSHETDDAKRSWKEPKIRQYLKGLTRLAR